MFVAPGCFGLNGALVVGFVLKEPGEPQRREANVSRAAQAARA
jgi:hypothetical protein